MSKDETSWFLVCETREKLCQFALFVDEKSIHVIEFSRSRRQQTVSTPAPPISIPKPGSR